MTRPAPIVVALGGNALSPPGERDNVELQFARTRQTVEALVPLVLAETPLVLTHGNGPQVGNAVRRIEIARHEVYSIPLDVLVADLQGGLGYMVAQCLNNALVLHGSERRATVLITTVEVDGDDPSFARPDKPIGPILDRTRAETDRARGWELREVEPGKFRRLVPSPPPLRILEIDLIRKLVSSNWTLIAAGGGGVPVVRAADGTWSGREAVIDKDRTAALLAREVGASTLLMVTNVDRVRLDWGRPDERPIDRMTPAEARAHLASGQFPAGSMGPKIEAAIDFVTHARSEGARAIITCIDRMSDALAGRGGTVIERAPAACMSRLP